MTTELDFPLGQNFTGIPFANLQPYSSQKPYLRHVFYRRKIILALLQLFDGQLDKIRLQKLLFLFTRQQTKATYDFIPYRFGCFSYSANADMTTMVARGMLSEDETHFGRKDTTDYLGQLTPDDRRRLMETYETYGHLSANALMRHTYLHYPFYASKSEVAPKILSKTELEIVRKSTPESNETVLFTIGYEGISLEEYLLRLVKHDVKVLVDVRNNPLSMKYGFSKSKLQTFCENLGIGYVHFPEVGIQSAQRQELNDQSDYDRLFDTYRTNNLTKTIDAQHRILDLLNQYKRIALTCFEADACQCHRKPLAEAIAALSGFSYGLKHI